MFFTINSHHSATGVTADNTVTYFGPACRMAGVPIVTGTGYGRIAVGIGTRMMRLDGPVFIMADGFIRRIPGAGPPAPNGRRLGFHGAPGLNIVAGRPCRRNLRFVPEFESAAGATTLTV